MNTEIQLNPSDISEEALDRLAFALIGKLNKYFVVDKLLTKQEAADFVRVEIRTFHDRLVSGHYPPEIIHWDAGTMLFLPSELVEVVKRRKNKRSRKAQQ